MAHMTNTLRRSQFSKDACRAAVFNPPCLFSVTAEAISAVIDSTVLIRGQSRLSVAEWKNLFRPDTEKYMWHLYRKILFAP